MQIAIIGCGAMGSIYAGLLADAGNQVVAIDTNEVHVQAINTNGLRISGASGDRNVNLRAFTRAPEEVMDLVIFAVKAAHISSAATSAKSLLGADTLVLTIQNGLGSADTLSEVVGDQRLIVGVAQGFGASLLEPGHAHHNAMKAIRMGAFAQLSSDAVERVAALWRAAGFDAQSVADIAATQWEKLICNVAYSAACALTGMTIGEAMDDPALGPVSRAAASEAFEVAKARGIKLSFDDPIAHVRDFAARMPDAKPSVLLDIQAGRASEVGFINGAVRREAKKVGLSAPINTTLTGLVQALETQQQSITRGIANIE